MCEWTYSKFRCREFEWRAAWCWKAAISAAKMMLSIAIAGAIFGGISLHTGSVLPSCEKPSAWESYCKRSASVNLSQVMTNKHQSALSAGLLYRRTYGFIRFLKLRRFTSHSSRLAEMKVMSISRSHWNETVQLQHKFIPQQPWGTHAGMIITGKEAFKLFALKADDVVWVIKIWSFLDCRQLN